MNTTAIAYTKFLRLRPTFCVYAIAVVFTNVRELRVVLAAVPHRRNSNTRVIKRRAREKRESRKLHSASLNSAWLQGAPGKPRKYPRYLQCTIIVFLQCTRNYCKGGCEHSNRPVAQNEADNKSEKKEKTFKMRGFEMPVQEHHRPQGCIPNTVPYSASRVTYRYGRSDTGTVCTSGSSRKSRNWAQGSRQLPSIVRLKSGDSSCGWLRRPFEKIRAASMTEESALGSPLCYRFKLRPRPHQEIHDFGQVGHYESLYLSHNSP